MPRCGISMQPRDGFEQPAVIKTTSTSGTQFQLFEAGRDIQADLSLHAQRLQRDGVVGTAVEPVGADPDTCRRTALRAAVTAGEVTGPKPSDRSEHPPCQRGLFGDAEIDTDLLDARNVEVVRAPVSAKNAAQIGDRTYDKAHARATTAFKYADLNALWLLSSRNRSGQNDGGRNSQR